VNSRVNSATKVHRVHQGMATNCEPILPSIPQDADLLDLDSLSEPLRELLHAAVQIKGVLIPVATKVLHRKRRSLVPMLDSVVIRHYLSAPEYKALLPGTESKDKAANVAMEALRLSGTTCYKRAARSKTCSNSLPERVSRSQLSAFSKSSSGRRQSQRVGIERQGQPKPGSRGEVSGPQGSSTPRPRRVVQSARAFGSPPGTCLRTRVAVT